jgi:16S rRNA C1402 (ribose-2'-O) methylase RsmI
MFGRAFDDSAIFDNSYFFTGFISGRTKNSISIVATKENKNNMVANLLKFITNILNLRINAFLKTIIKTMEIHNSAIVIKDLNLIA